MSLTLLIKDSVNLLLYYGFGNKKCISTADVQQIYDARERSGERANQDNGLTPSVSSDTSVLNCYNYGRLTDSLYCSTSPRTVCTDTCGAAKKLTS
ncbi:hypothetical protein TNCV_2288041 [Trichonephila clavipes]|nr:hypothetical protein TNCV_2288041 [Trichonephila clavipes]